MIIQQQNDDEQQWLESMESDDGLEMGEAVKIQDPISSLQLEDPIVFEKGTSIRTALNQMQNQSENYALVRSNAILIGILTERDILMKITGKGYDLNITLIEEFMTADPETLTMEDPLAYALNKMHVGGFRHVPIVDENHHPVAIISLSKIVSIVADFFSQDIINLPPLDRMVDTSNPEGG
ncbi:MAG: CBS domain-containing protein [Candidatus Marinimicrobia bacterium]|jgi:CBS domain-containing protein|nr:CBS domain-containing protein [Candidatus Neomarinimicrobiota bacterium]MBT3496132.1 CBS domain-containing protein [Candidatus Neomarinimicrobiota bacterium]MBT3692701.1 CBS domain-containing protein [Candidatus Neomarinimicrobiota bacterium]MBT3731858.1 CBS domain-containing protein [Candidatus Neomarinimicrobiota bacterium]MBT4144568.1 CBS domain-containing protein [Candidatus Neomarinimicrobiota bacterium]